MNEAILALEPFKQQTRCGRVVLWRVQQDGGGRWLVPSLFEGVEEAILESIKIPLSGPIHSVVQAAIETLQPSVINSVEHHIPSLDLLQKKTGIAIKQLLTIPILNEKGVVGCLQGLNKEGPFMLQDLEHGLACAGQLAGVLKGIQPLKPQGDGRAFVEYQPYQDPAEALERFCEEVRSETFMCWLDMKSFLLLERLPERFDAKERYIRLLFAPRIQGFKARLSGIIQQCDWLCSFYYLRFCAQIQFSHITLTKERFIRYGKYREEIGKEKRELCDAAFKEAERFVEFYNRHVELLQHLLGRFEGFEELFTKELQSQKSIRDLDKTLHKMEQGLEILDGFMDALQELYEANDENNPLNIHPISYVTLQHHLQSWQKQADSFAYMGHLFPILLSFENSQIEPIFTDTRLLYEVIEALLENAMEELAIGMMEQRVAHPRMHLTLHPKESWLEVVLCDNGRGMDGECSKKLYRKGFTQGKRMHRGFGLFRAWNNLQRLKSSLRLELAEGRTCFSFQIPRDLRG